jgi:AAA family ATP:ADP antiporter
MRDRRALQIAVYMMLVGFVATAFEAAQTELVGNEIDLAWQQKSFLADVGLYGNGLVLALQVFCTGQLMPRLRAVTLLSSLPVVSIIGLILYSLAPSAGVIFVLQVARRGANYAFEKPAREVLYTPLDLETKHKVKFLLDTFALRLGDLGGAVVQVWLRDLGFGIGAIVTVTIVFAMVWIGIACLLGRSAPSEAR